MFPENLLELMVNTSPNYLSPKIIHIKDVNAMCAEKNIVLCEEQVIEILSMANIFHVYGKTHMYIPLVDAIEKTIQNKKALCTDYALNCAIRAIHTQYSLLISSL